jgi:hypothetical protein
MSFDDLAKRMAASQGAPLPPPGELPTPAQLARANQRASAHREITSGAILLVAGLAITLFTYGSVSSGGGTYVIAYGPMIVGAIRLVRGLMNSPDRTPEEIAAAGRVDRPARTE